jgi:LuxR family transcriptional activator of conjugal transfer of Ti plasmids
MPDAPTSSALTSLPVSSSTAQLAEEATQAIDAASSAGDLYAWLGSFCEAIGFDYFAYFAFDPRRQGDGATTNPMAGASYPSHWRAHYLRLGYQHHDPLLRAGSTMRRAFTWDSSEFASRLEGKARQMSEEARAFGICAGVSVPVYGPAGDRGLLSLSGRATGAAFSAIVREYLPVLHLAAHLTHAAMVERLMQPAPDEIRLTEQERECLTWTLRGKTAWEIAHIIGRSRATVNFHLQKSLRKLGASSKYQAATKAMQAGLI